MFLPLKVIEFKSVSKSFGPTLAVNNISFSIPKGGITCLIGPSGCGKTTTLKMINRLIEPTSGSIYIDKKNHEDSDAITLRRNIGYVIQQVGLFPHMTVEKNICLLETIKGNSNQTNRERLKYVLNLVGLENGNFKHRFPHQLSGGQQQRVGIARALMSDPQILLMDEPFGALDPIIRSKMHKEFLDLNKRLQKTIVLVTHDLHEAFKLGDQIILLNKGCIEQIGTKGDFLQNPENDFCREFVAAQMED